MTVGELIEQIRAQGVVLEVTQAGTIRYSGRPLNPAYVAALRANRDQVKAVLTLEARLFIGWARCEAQADPGLLGRYEDHWVDLLQQYQAACDVPRVVDVEEAA